MFTSVCVAVIARMAVGVVAVVFIPSVPFELLGVALNGSWLSSYRPGVNQVEKYTECSL
jgi:hypothetical protein